jgi:small subunit ribosomal protein S2
MEIVTMRQLLECGVHFGHQTKRWNPKMKKYIFTSRNGIHVIDLQQTIKLIKSTYEYVKNISREKGTILFVGTKKQAQDAIKASADECGMPFVHHRWLGGTLTNISTIRQSINKLKKNAIMAEDGTYDKLSNKEASRKLKMLEKLKYNFDGIKNMTAVPSAIFIVDTKREQLAVKEANKLGIPIIGIVDTNADPTEVQLPIPANDDAIRAIKLICSIMAKAVQDGQASQVQMEEAAKAKSADQSEEGSVAPKSNIVAEAELKDQLEGESKGVASTEPIGDVAAVNAKKEEVKVPAAKK